MTNPHQHAILEALTDAPLTVDDLQRETDLPGEHLDEALFYLSSHGKVRRLPGGRYKRCDVRHSRAVRRGLFVKAIPQLVLGCAYVAASYPVVERLQGFAGVAL